MPSMPSLPAPASRPFDFMAVGENSLDLFCVAETFPEPDQKHRLRQLVELPGGQAATAAVACARLGWRCRYAGALGSDHAADVVRETLSRERLDLQLIVKPHVRTRRAIIFVEQSTGRRTVLESRDDRLNVAEGEVAAEIFTSARIMLVDGADPALSVRAARAARASGARTIVDVDQVSDGSLALLREIDVVIVPASFVKEATGQSQLGTGLAQLGRESGAAILVATMGSEGALAWTGFAEVHVPAHPSPVVDTTGAGDAFRGAFAAAWLDSSEEPSELVEILRFAATVAAWNCRSLGAWTGLPTRADLAAAGV